MNDGQGAQGQLDEGELKRRWDRRLSEISLPDPFDIVTFCDTIAATRGRPIRLLEFHEASPDSPSGMWVKADDVDYIYYERDTTRVHQQHIVLHELGHMLAGHLADPSLSASYRQSYLPNLDPAMLARILGRTDYSAEQEYEAEWFAREIGRQVSDATDLSSRSSHSDAVARAQAALGRRW